MGNQTKWSGSALLVLLTSATAALAGVTSYTAPGLTLGLDDNGRVVKFTDLITGVERITQIAIYQQPFVQVTFQGQVYSPTGCTPSGNQWTYTFSNVAPQPTVTVQLVGKSKYIEVTLVGATNYTTLDSIRFVNIPALGSLDGALYRFLRYNDNGQQRYACITPLDQWTATTVLPAGGGNYLWATAYPSLTFPTSVPVAGRKVALFACDATQTAFFDVMATLDADYALPTGVQGKQTPKINTSEIFWMGGEGGFGYADRDSVLQFTQAMGAGRMLIHDMLWGDQKNAWVVASMWGSTANLKAWVQQCQSAGQLVGSHLLVGIVPKQSIPYIAAGADSRLYRDRTITLAATIDSAMTAGLIQTTTSPAGWPLGVGERDFVIDNEIIQYSSIKTDAPPYGFVGPFTRAKNQSLMSPQAHSAGASIQHLLNNNDDWGYFWDCGATNGIGRNTADMAVTLNQIGFDYVYADEMRNIDPGGYGGDLQAMAVYNAMNPKPRWFEASADSGFFAWQYTGVDGQVDYTYIETTGFKSEVDRNVAYITSRAKYITYLTPQLGWAEIFNPMSPYRTAADDIEYLYAKSLAWDWPVTIQIWFNTIKSAPNRDALFYMMKRYETLRLNGGVSAQERLNAQRPQKDFMLFNDNFGAPHLAPVSLQPIGGGSNIIRGFLSDGAIDGTPNGPRYMTLWPVDGQSHKLTLVGVSVGQMEVRDYQGNLIALGHSLTGGAPVITVNTRLYIKLMNVANPAGVFAGAMVQ